MKGTVYGNRLPMGTQGKKDWEPLLQSSRRPNESAIQCVCLYVCVYVCILIPHDRV